MYNVEKKSQKLLTLSGQGSAEPEQMGDISAMTVSAMKHPHYKVLSRRNVVSVCQHDDHH